MGFRALGLRPFQSEDPACEGFDNLWVLDLKGFRGCGFFLKVQGFPFRGLGLTSRRVQLAAVPLNVNSPKSAKNFARLGGETRASGTLAAEVCELSYLVSPWFLFRISSLRWESLTIPEPLTRDLT